MRGSEVGLNSTLETNRKQFASFAITINFLQKMGVSALVSHMNDKHHMSIVKDTISLQSLFVKTNRPETSVT